MVLEEEYLPSTANRVSTIVACAILVITDAFIARSRQLSQSDSHDETAQRPRKQRKRQQPQHQDDDDREEAEFDPGHNIMAMADEADCQLVRG
jgi:hypothetical protein